MGAQRLIQTGMPEDRVYEQKNPQGEAMRRGCSSF